MLVDFQMAKISSTINDLSYLSYISQHPSKRSQLVKSMTQAYFDHIQCMLTKMNIPNPYTLVGLRSELQASRYGILSAVFVLPNIAKFDKTEDENEQSGGSSTKDFPTAAQNNENFVEGRYLASVLRGVAMEFENLKVVQQFADSERFILV